MAYVLFLPEFEPQVDVLGGPPGGTGGLCPDGLGGAPNENHFGFMSFYRLIWASKV